MDNQMDKDMEMDMEMEATSIMYRGCLRFEVQSYPKRLTLNPKP